MTGRTVERRSRAKWGRVLAWVIALCAVASVARADDYTVIEVPAVNGVVMSPFAFTGYGFDVGGGDGPGVDMVQVYLCNTSCAVSSPYFLGIATFGIYRPDVAAAYGAPRLTYSGFSLTADLAQGTYEALVLSHSYFGSGWTMRSVPFTVATNNPQAEITSPGIGWSISQPYTITGWAINASSSAGSGVDAIHVYMYPSAGSGQPLTFLGYGTLGVATPSVAATYGAQFANAGYTFPLSGLPPGFDVFFVYDHLTTGPWDVRAVYDYVDEATTALTIDRQGTGTGGISASGLSCPGGSGTQALPCGGAYSFATWVTMTAVPDYGSSFAGWTGACSGMGTCTVEMDVSRFVAATFTKTATTYATTYCHTDVIGSVRAITDAAGATVIRHDYGPFGEDPQPLTGDPIRFAGKELDPETALEYFEARYYRQTWGRFATVDPMGGSVGDPQSFNRYAYARNNPLRFTDSTGACVENPARGEYCADALPADGAARRHRRILRMASCTRVTGDLPDMAAGGISTVKSVISTTHKAVCMPLPTAFLMVLALREGAATARRS